MRLRNKRRAGRQAPTSVEQNKRSPSPNEGNESLPPAQEPAKSIEDTCLPNKEDSKSPTADQQPLNVITTRGRTRMKHVVKRRTEGCPRPKIQVNCKGQPIGRESTQMMSYLGVLARSKIPITYKSWKNVPAPDKDVIWEEIMVSIQFLHLFQYTSVLE